MPVHCTVWKEGVPAPWAPDTNLPSCPQMSLGETKGALLGCLPLKGAHNLQVLLP